MTWADARKPRTISDTRSWFKEPLGERYHNMVVRNIHLRDAVPMLMGLEVINSLNGKSLGVIEKLVKRSDGYLDLTTDKGQTNYFQEFQLFEDGDMAWIYGSSYLIKAGACGLCKYDCKMLERCWMFEEREL